MSTIRQVESHDSVVGTDNCGVDGEVGRRSGQRLNVDSPLGRVESEDLEGSLLAEQLHLIDELVSSVVAGSRVAFTVLVAHRRAERIHYSLAGEVLRGDKLEPATLSALLLEFNRYIDIHEAPTHILHNAEHLWIDLLNMIQQNVFIIGVLVTLDRDQWSVHLTIGHFAL